MTALSPEALPALRVDDWTATRDTLHLFTQIVGKVRMALATPVNHWWHVTLYLSARGLTTGAIPVGDRVLDLEFDLAGAGGEPGAERHALVARTSDGGRESIALDDGLSVAAFYEALLAALARLGVEARIRPVPNEVAVAIPFPDDTAHATYDAAAARAFWRQLVFAERVMQRFRAEFTGKVSPVHYFWGAMDLAVTRFSGRPAPVHPGGAPNCPDWVMHEGYSHELSSAGFWPGGGDEGAFYSYAYPAPAGFADAPVPEGASFSEGLGEFLLPWEAVRRSGDPEGLVLKFLRATYEAGSVGGSWPEVRRD